MTRLTECSAGASRPRSITKAVGGSTVPALVEICQRKRMVRTALHRAECLPNRRTAHLIAEVVAPRRDLTSLLQSSAVFPTSRHLDKPSPRGRIRCHPIVVPTPNLDGTIGTQGHGVTEPRGHLGESRLRRASGHNLVVIRAPRLNRSIAPTSRAP